MKIFFFSILALFAFSFLVSAQSDFQEVGVDASADDASAGEGALTALIRVFSVADNPTEITFTRTLSVPFNAQSNTGSITETASFKISGRLKETDSGSSEDKVFEFQNGTIEWNFQQNSDDGGTRCRRQQVVSGTGKDAISNLNIPFDTNGGKDASGNYVHLNNYGLKLVYKKQGLSGKSEFSIVGQVLIPMDYTQIETPVAPATCNGDSDPYTFTQKKPIVTQFPVTLLNFDTAKSSQTGQLVATEPTGNQFKGTVVSSSQEAEFTKFVHVTPISLGGDQSPWNVNWKIELPTPGQKIDEFIETVQEIDTDGDRLTDVEERAYGTDINNRDTDGDGLLDSWEVNGVYIGGVNALDLPSMGSHPLKKDVFLEIDWMQNANHSHKPENAALQRVVNAFATKGIRLHIDTGQWSGGNSVPEQPNAAWHQLNFINFSEEPTYLTNNLYLFDIKKDNFNSKRIGIFYYGIFVHERSDSSGQAEVGGNFFVALPFDDTIAAKSGTLMHEFGHTLQLGHGGRLDDELQYDSTQFKPNYRSIMNYHFQFNGVPRINQSGTIVYDLDYSEEALADLNESAGLNEANGLTSQDLTAVSFYSCVNAGHGLNAPDVMYRSGSNLVPWFVLNGIGVDWDCDGAIAGNPKISVNGFDGSQFNNSGPLELMVGRSDWDKVVLKIGCGDYGLESEITDENKIRVGRLLGNCSELTDIRASLGYTGELDNPTLPPRYPFIGEACDGVDNDSDGQVDEGCSDSDNDGVVDDIDNCPEVANADQRDSNSDFVGDACSEEYFFSKATVGTESSENVQEEQQTEAIQNEIIGGLGQDSENQPMAQLGLLSSLFGFDFGAILLALGAAVLIGGIVLILLIIFILKKLLHK